MELYHGLTILALILGPILAIQVQKRLEAIRDHRNTKMKIFHTLMATRAARISFEHVRALNLIEIEFIGKKEKLIRDAWKTYLDHLGESYDEANQGVWIQRGDDLFVDLLWELARSLDYDFDKVTLKKGCYIPKAHGYAELDTELIRMNLADILSGRKPFPITLFSQQNNQS